MMKKIFFSSPLTAAVLAALTFAACSQSDTIADGNSVNNVNNAPQAVEFGTYMGAQGTRATGGTVGDITTSVLKGDHYGFGVVAYHTDAENWAGTSNTTIPNFMWNQKVTWDATNEWTYTPVKFWPNDFSTGKVDNKEGKDEGKEAWGSQNGGKISFFAYAPYVNFATNSTSYKNKTASRESTAATDGITAITANSVGAEPQVYYILSNADVNNAVDLLWGLRGNSFGYNLATNTKDQNPVTADYNVNLTKQSVSEKVNFLFKHALAKIGGHTPNTDPAGLQTGLQVVLDIDDGSLGTGVKTGTAITDGIKQDVTLVTVESIEIYDQKSAKDAGITNLTKGTSDLVKEGWFNIATGAWDLTTGESTVQVGATYSSKVGTSDTDNNGELNAQIKEGTPTAVTTGTPATFSKWQISDADVTGVTTTPQDVYTNDSDVPSLILIPSTTTSQTLVVRVKYIVRTYDANLNASASGETNGTWTKVTQTITNEVTIPANALQSNKYYKLLIHLGLTSVKFTASVVDWEEAAASKTPGTDNQDSNNDKDVYLPSNTLNTTTTASTETVNSATVAVGASKIYSVPATAGTFTVNLTEIDANNTTSTVTAVATGADAAVVPSVNYTNSQTTGTVSIALTANTSTAETRTTTLTIKSKNSSNADVTTVVTLVQVPATTPAP